MTEYVWAIDRKPYYGLKQPHSYLFVFALVLLVVLWIPYTFLLLLMQCLRRIDHYRGLRFIGRYKPFYDAHFGPLNDRHHYWFGLLLLVRGVLYLFLPLHCTNIWKSTFIFFLLSYSFYYVT